MRKLFGLVLVVLFIWAGMGFAQFHVRTTGGTIVMTVDDGGDADLLGTMSADSVRIKHGTAAAGMVPFSYDDSGVLVWSLAPGTDGQVLKWNATASQWEPGPDDGGTSYSGGTGITISGSTIDADATTAMWNADALQGNDVSTTAPSSGQALKWNGSAWAPAADANTEYSAGTGMNLSGTTFNAQTTSALWNANALQGSDVSSTAPSTNGQVLKWNATASQWEPGPDDGGTSYSGGTGITISGSTINADAATAMWNADALQGNNVSTTAPSNGQALKWNGSAWAPATDANTTYSAGTGLTLSGNTFNAQASTAMWNADELQGNTVSTATPSSGQVLKWNGSAWAPQSDQTGASYWNGTAGTGSAIDRTGDVIIGSTTGDALELSYDSTSDESTIQSGGGSNPIYIKGSQLVFVIQ